MNDLQISLLPLLIPFLLIAATFFVLSYVLYDAERKLPLHRRHYRQAFKLLVGLGFIVFLSGLLTLALVLSHVSSHTPPA